MQCCGSIPPGKAAYGRATVLSRVYQRAAIVRAGLRRLWGEELPPGIEPVLKVLVDAVALDDEHGVRADLVVQSDGLTLDTLTALLRAGCPPEERLELLPPLLRRRLGHAHPVEGAPLALAVPPDPPAQLQ